MRIKKNKRILVLSGAIFLTVLAFLIASIPKERDKTPITIVVKSGTSLPNIAYRLKEDGIIHSSCLFMLFSLFYRGQLIAGEYELRKDMSTIGIVKKMGRGERNIYTLRIIEGSNLYNVSDAIEKSRIMGRDEFLRVAKDLTFLRRLGIDAGSLEGYLAPDTYYYSREVDAEPFIERIIQKTIRIFAGPDIRQRMEALKLDIHKTLIIASMIEREAKKKEEKPVISAVFHNRLRKDMPLDCDPTVTYGTGRFGFPIRKSDLTTYTPYNTYSFKGLPKGPICNPDKNSIHAALYPAPAEFLYFVSKNDGTHVFSRDISEHSRFVMAYQRAKNTKKR